jgi:hypothetical protein
MNDCEMYANLGIYKCIVDYVVLNESFPTKDVILDQCCRFDIKDIVLFDNVYVSMKRLYDSFMSPKVMKQWNLCLEKYCFGDERVMKLLRRIYFHMYMTGSTGSCIAYSLMAYCGLRKLGYNPVFCSGSAFHFNGSKFFFGIGLHCWIELDNRVLDIAIVGNAVQSRNVFGHISPKYFFRYAYMDVVYMPGVILHGKQYFNVGDWKDFSTSPVSGEASKELWNRYGIILAKRADDDVYSMYSGFFDKDYDVVGLVVKTMGQPVKYVDVDKLNEVTFFKLFLDIEKERSISEYVELKGFEMELITGMIYHNSALIKEGVEYVEQK